MSWALSGNCLGCALSVGLLFAGVRGEIVLKQGIERGRRVTPSVSVPYRPRDGQRFVVSSAHQIPSDMVVQGDTVRLRVGGVDANRVQQPRWILRQRKGNASLGKGTDIIETRFHADGFGKNVIEFCAVIDGQTVRHETTIFVEFSTENMIEVGHPVPLPADHQPGVPVRKPQLPELNHREQCTVRHPGTGRLVTFWQVNYLPEQPDDGPMGVAVMHSDDHGITWTNKRYLYLNPQDNSGWGTMGWNPRGNGGRGELLLFTCSHIRSPDNRLMLFRSRDAGETWRHLDDLQRAIAGRFGKKNALLTYFGVNRLIATSRGTLVAPMVVDHYERVIWSDDNGESWRSSNIDHQFPHGNENAIVETVDGGRLILFARPHYDVPAHNYRFESSDGGRTWSDVGRSWLPTAVANLGVDVIREPGTAWHGHVLHACAATKSGPHGGRQRTVLAINSDPVDVRPDAWDMRLLWDARANYSDVLYLPEDRSIFVSIETILPGTDSPLGYEAIRYFKMSHRYWQHLPRYEAGLQER